MLAQYKKHGYVVLRNIIPDEYVKIAQEECMRIRKWVSTKPLGEKSDRGSGYFWKGVEVAGKLSEPLMQLYRSKFNTDIARQYLESDTIYYFNDQVVVKLPKEKFEFKPHYDNQFGQDPTGNFKIINCGWILDEMTEQTGALSVKHDGVWKMLELHVGDMLLLDGNCWHKSGNNLSDKPRRFWACCYALEKPKLDGFYSEKVEDSAIRN